MLTTGHDGDIAIDSAMASHGEQWLWTTYSDSSDESIAINGTNYSLMLQLDCSLFLAFGNQILLPEYGGLGHVELVESHIHVGSSLDLHPVVSN